MTTTAADVLRNLSQRIAELETEKQAAILATQDAIRRAAILSPLDDTELGRVAGCGREHMNKFRNGRKGMGLKGLCSLAEFFGGEVVICWSQGECNGEG